MANSPPARRVVVEIKISPEDIQHRRVEITGLRTLGRAER